MSRPSAKSIAFNRSLRCSWVVEGLRLLGEGVEREAWVERMGELLSRDIAGRDSLRKSMRYLRHLWIEPGANESLRAGAVALHRDSRDPARDRALAWGMASATYPFLMETAESACRILRVQPEMKLEQLLRKLCASFGEKETVRRSGRYALGLITELGFLERAGGPGRYRQAPPLKIEDPRLADWLLRAWFMATGTRGTVDRIALNNHPGLGFFHGASLVDAAVRQGGARIERLSLSTEVVSMAD